MKKKLIQKQGANRSAAGSVATGAPFIWPRFAAPGLLAALILLMFGDALFFRSGMVLSQSGTDLFLYFIYWRDFGFRELAHGNLALWNPHIFSGVPAFGGFQAALLYPLNWIYLILPLTFSLNFEIVLHTALLGVFMFLWTSRRGLHPFACLVASVIMMFCGASFLHIYAGHLTLIGCAAWAPLILLCVDGFFGVETRKFPWRWVLIGMMAVAMQIYVGHPQYLFNTGVGSALYLAFCLIRAKNRVKPVLAYAAMYGGGMALSAVQLLASAHTGAESTRGAGGFTYQESAFFSLPPENIVTLIAPWFFGKGLGGADAGLAYWGRCYIWEMSLFIGVTGLFLAIYGAVCGERAVRRYSAPMALILLILALGGHTPLLHLLHSLVPGFNRFRGQSKFIFEASVFVSMLSAVGMDRLLRDQEFKKLLPIIAGGAAAGLALFAILISATAGAGGWWSGMPALVLRSAESYYFMRDPNLASNPEFLTKSAGAAAGSLWIASLTCAVLAAALYFLRFDRRAAYAIGALAILEVFLFARTARPMFEIAPALHPEYLQKFHDLNPGDYRILNPAGNDNAMMSMGLQGLWGYDPQVNRRYAEFMYFTQKQNPDKASYSLQFAGINPLYRLLRCKYLFVPGDQGISLRELSDPLPHAL
ncbi:hypothetical protein HY256_06995, partial [Candidatus Sumerlaeota bacterium]|nr:hypothetical protein [Candidatus Sumerlaeota bacterium]